MYLRGIPQAECADRIGVSRSQVSYDLAILRARWQKSAAADFAAKVAKELARIDHLEAVAWEAWERSCEAEEIFHAGTEGGRVDKDGKPLPDRTRTSKTVRHQYGDPRFLERVAWCVEQRCRVCGMNAETAVRLNLSGQASGGPSFSEEEKEFALDYLAGRLRNRGGLPPLNGPHP
jgi:hypothetical protein